jgi:hypothetical protein
MIFCPKKRWEPEKSEFPFLSTTDFVGIFKRAPVLLMGINTRGFFLADCSFRENGKKLGFPLEKP